MCIVKLGATFIHTPAAAAVALFTVSIHFSGFAAVDACVILGPPIRTNGQLQFTLTGEPNVSYVLEQSADSQSWISILTNTSSSISRTITTDATGELSFYRASRGPLPLFAFAIGAKGSINLGGNGIQFDSFDSSNSQYSTDGRYDAAKARDHADIIFPSVTNAPLSIANARIKGAIRTSPGVLPTIGPNGSVGDAAWVDGGDLGIKPGWWNDDAYVCWPNVLPPFTTGLAMTGGTWNGTNYTYLLGTANYLVNGSFTLLNGQILCVAAGEHAVLYATGSVDFKLGSLVYIAANATLKLFVGGATANFSTVNMSGSAEGLQVFGLPTNTSSTWSSPTSTYKGVIYAPGASVTVSTGGSGALDFEGALISRTFVANGHLHFHFDEALVQFGPTR